MDPDAASSRHVRQPHRLVCTHDINGGRYGAPGLRPELSRRCFLLIGLIPFLGWLNWLTTVPLSALAAILCYVAIRDRPNVDPLVRVGLLSATFILLLALFRLSLGGGLL